MNRLRRASALGAVWLCFLAAARGQSSSGFSGPNRVSSVSGQFIVTFTPPASPFYHSPTVATNAHYLHLDPAFLAMSAEHFRTALWGLIGLPAGSSWSGRIFIALHPAHSTNETVVIAADPFLHYWNYHLRMPNLISRNRFARAMTAVMLMEFANRGVAVNARPAKPPAWLVDGLARQIIGADAVHVIFSMPVKDKGGLALTRIDKSQRGLDPLTASRRILQTTPALTFNQLCWPDNAQENGRDGGVYLASAQLFVNDLLALPHGRAKLRDFLARLPGCEDWQTAFFAVYQPRFQSLLDVEKWWSLRVLSFAIHNRGPRWTEAASRHKLDAILSVPVDMRYASNQLPRHAEISLQAAVRDFQPPQQTQILAMVLRDLKLVQLRLAAPFAPVVASYRQVLSDYLRRHQPGMPSRHRRNDEVNLIAQLDRLDQQRQKVEARLQRAAPPVPAPRNNATNLTQPKADL